MKAEHFFSSEEKDKVEAAIKAAETQTSGEIAVIIVNESDPYPEAAMLGGFLGGGLSALVLTDLFFHDSLWIFIPILFCLFYPFHRLTSKTPGLKAFFLSMRRKEVRVKTRALQAFYEKGLYKTRHQTGVLFFLSLLERKVWVLADQGIHQKMDQKSLNRFAEMVTQGIREGKAGESLNQAIGEIGRVLAEHFPHIPEDIDELPNTIMTVS